MTPDMMKGGLYGLLIADALGVPYEFKSPAEIPDEISFTLPEGYKRAHPNAPERAWSDDGAQALCLLESLLEIGGFEARNFANKLIAWKNEGYLAINSRTFDIGITTRESLERIEHGMTVLKAGSNDERSNGNGSLMRVLPLALWHQGSDAELAQLSMQQSQITHAHPISKVACAIYALWARKITQQEANPFFAATLAFESAFPEGSEEIDILDRHIKPRVTPEVGEASGYVLDSLNIARLVLPNSTSYKEAVDAAIRYGHDTDTNACVVGGLAGLKFGYNNIPKALAFGLEGQEMVRPLLAQLSLEVFGRVLD